MEVIKKYMLIGVLAFALSASMFAYIQLSRARVATAELKRVQADLAASKKSLKAANADAKARAKIDAEQSAARAAASTRIQGVQSELNKERELDENRTLGTPAELDRLRRLVQAGNATVRAAQ
jgi:hypothetical protein